MPFSHQLRSLMVGAAALSLACSACSGGSPAVPADIRDATSNFSGGSDVSRMPRFRPLQDSVNNLLARACVAGTGISELERMGVADLHERLDTLVAARVIRLDGRRCEPGFPVFLGTRRAQLTREADAAAARLLPFVESLSVRVGALAGARGDVRFHLLWSRVMDEAWDQAWRRAFPRDSLPAVRWLVVPERRLAVGTNYSQATGGGSLAVTWAPRFTRHLAPLGDHEFELSKLAWRHPRDNDSVRALLAGLGVLDSAGASRVFAYPRGGPVDSALGALAREYGERAAAAADWASVGARLGTDPRDLFVVLLHEVAYSVYERLVDAGRLDVPRALTEGAPRTDAVHLVSLVLGEPPRPGDEAMAAYARNDWRGSEEVVRQLRLAIAADPRNIRYHWTLGLCLYDMGRYAEAAREFGRIAPAARRDSSARYLADWSLLWIAHAYDALGQRKRALSIYREVARSGEAEQQMMMGQYRIGPITARAWAKERLAAPFRVPN